MSSTRREVVQSIGAMALAAANAATQIPRRPLGKTGLQVSILGLGGAPIGNLDDGRQARDVVRRCYDMGVTYFDCASAGAYGLSQMRYGLALKDVRDKIVFATKTRNRTMTQAQLDLDQSLANLKTDRIDLYQVHNVMNDEDIEFIFGPKGVMEMIEKARKAGKIRFVGFTGHTDPRIHNKMIERYDFSTVLMPLSVTDGGNSQKSFEQLTLPLAKKKGMGVIAMKTLGAGQILQKKAATVDECLRYVWTLPVSTAIVGLAQLTHVDAAVALARDSKQLPAAEIEQLRRRMAGYASLEPWKRHRDHAEGEPAYRAD
ncbi:MAG: aldo/keto reductase [Acidobacteria bacterium]|nr:aldo/keto reductase [Acidobacteriota bacterium]